MPGTRLLIGTFNCTGVQPFAELYLVSGVRFASCYFSSQQAEKVISLFVRGDMS